MSSPILPSVNKSIKKAIAKNIFIPDIGGGASVAPITRNFITFSSMDGGYAIASEDIQLLADDEIIIESQLYDSPNIAGFTWLITGNRGTDTRIAMAGNNRFNLVNIDEIQVDDQATLYDADGSGYVYPTYNYPNMHTTRAVVYANGIFKRVACRWDGAESPDCIIARITIKRAGQTIHDWDFNVDSSTDVIEDSAGSRVTFTLVNVLPEMRVNYTFEEPNKWVNSTNSNDIIEVI